MIEQRENGPLVAKDSVQLKSRDGSKLEIKEVAALCRCGLSKNKPYCDGSHEAAGFSSANETEKKDGRLFSYKGEEITVHFNKLLCGHAAECGRLNSEVFNVKQQPWIQPEKGDADSIRAVVAACPSGALTLTENDGDISQLVEEGSEITIQKDGPYWVRNIALDDAGFAESASKNKYILCRCGLSKNKPFCDGTHLDEKWRDDADI